MSKVWNNFIEKVMGGNPYTKDDLLNSQLDAEHQEYNYLREEWIEGKRSHLTHSIKEWDYLGKPRPKNAYNQ